MFGQDLTSSRLTWGKGEKGSECKASASYYGEGGKGGGNEEMGAVLVVHGSKK